MIPVIERASVEDLNALVEAHLNTCNNTVIEDTDYATTTPIVGRKLWYCEHCDFYVSTAEWSNGSFEIRTA